MPTQKDFKRLVRRRMQKTGESYTTARAQLLRTKPTRTSRPRVRPAAPAPDATAATPADFAKLAGMSDATLKAKTGCTWERWVRSLDHHQAHTWPHREIAAFVHHKYHVPGWWAQTVTVGYERIKGLRAIGQRRSGSFEANKSKTFAVPVAALFAAIAQPRQRARWLTGVKLTVRKATPHKTIRITWEDGSSVVVWLVAKGAGKSTAAVQHEKLPDRESAERMKRFWTERLDALGAMLTG